MGDFTKTLIDAQGHLANLTAGDWRLNRTMDQWPEMSFHKIWEYS